MIDPGDVTLETFAPLVGDAFTVRAADGAVQATLSAARSPEGHGYPDTVRAPFSLTFHGPVEPRLQQGMHALEHPAVGPIELFLVPVGLSADAAVYEVVFA